jgi:hypothetical protein
MASTEEHLESPPHTPISPIAEPTSPEVTGIKLYTLLACLTLVTFLSMLDLSIIGTVRPFLSHPTSLSNSS